MTKYLHAELADDVWLFELSDDAEIRETMYLITSADGDPVVYHENLCADPARQRPLPAVPLRRLSNEVPDGGARRVLLLDAGGRVHKYVEDRGTISVLH